MQNYIKKSEKPKVKYILLDFNEMNEVNEKNGSNVENIMNTSAPAPRGTSAIAGGYFPGRGFGYVAGI